MPALYIGSAGALGAFLRYACGLFLFPLYSSGTFPVTTLLINYLGCFALAWLIHAPAVAARWSDTTKTTWGTGFIGSFTTFSAFSVETVALASEGRQLLALLYVVLSLAGGWGFAWLGERLASRGAGRPLRRGRGNQA